MVNLGNYVSAAFIVCAILIFVGVNKDQIVVSTIGLIGMALSIITGYINFRVVSKKLDKQSRDEAKQMGII